jgi:hypothetical protein
MPYDSLGRNGPKGCFNCGENKNLAALETASLICHPLTQKVADPGTTCTPLCFISKVSLERIMGIVRERLNSKWRWANARVHETLSETFKRIRSFDKPTLSCRMTNTILRCATKTGTVKLDELPTNFLIEKISWQTWRSGYYEGRGQKFEKGSKLLHIQSL